MQSIDCWREEGAKMTPEVRTMDLNKLADMVSKHRDVLQEVRNELQEERPGLEFELDNGHPTVEGYAAMADRIHDMIRRKEAQHA